MSMPHHSTLFVYCNDVDAMRQFYTELIGMAETYYDSDRKWLTYQSGQLQIVYMEATTPRPVNEAWAKNPGQQGSGSDESPSWVLSVDATQFDAVYERLKTANVPLLDSPQQSQPGHRQFMTRWVHLSRYMR